MGYRVGAVNRGLGRSEEVRIDLPGLAKKDV